METCADTPIERNRAAALVAALIAGVAVLLGVWLRTRVLQSGVGDLNSDEATAGLMALDIRSGAFPVVIEGQAYTAVLESYPLAVLIAVFGAHPTILKVLACAFWGLGAIFALAAAQQTVGRFWGRLVAALCWVTPGAVLVVSTRAYPGYSIGFAAVCASFWATGRVLAGELPTMRSVALAGGLAGFALYIHPMYLSVVLPMLAVATWQHRREFRHWWFPASGAALAVNLPFLIWSVSNGLTAFENDTAQPGSYVERLGRFVSGLMPRGLGLMRPDGSWVMSRPWAIAAYLVIIVLLIVGVGSLARGDLRQRAIALTTVVVWPLMALFSAHGFVADGRYAIVPFFPVIVCLIAGAKAAASVPRRSDQMHRATIGAIVAVAWVGVLVLPYLGEVVGARVDDPNPTTTAIVRRLDDAGVDRVTGSYWLVQPVSLWTQGRIAAKPTWPQPIRSHRLADIVDQSAADTVAHLFANGEEWTWTLTMPVDNYLREEIGGAIVYLPIDQE